MFNIFPAQILSLFGDGDSTYVEFGVRFFRIYLFGVIFNFFQPVVSTFFTSIGKAYKGVFLSLTRQFLFLLPLLIVLPMHFGIDGILYAGPVSDTIALVITLIMMFVELKGIRKLEAQQEKI